MGLGPVTVGAAAYDTAFENERRPASCSPTSAAIPRGRWRRLPDTKSCTTAAFVDEQAAGIDQLLAIFYVLLALAVIVSLFGIVNTLVLATFERTRELGHAARGRHDAPAGAADGPPREHHHGADRRGHRHGRRPRARRRS